MKYYTILVLRTKSWEMTVEVLQLCELFSVSRCSITEGIQSSNDPSWEKLGTTPASCFLYQVDVF